MKKLLAVLATAVVLVLGTIGVDELSDLTQTRPDPVDPSRSSIVVFTVDTQAYDGTVAEAAAAQWGVCAGTVGGETSASAPDPLADGHFQVTVTPAIGPRGEQRLRGCLNDAAVDRVMSSFVSIANVPAS
jgi:hypothetical protein